jgi:hypothetical protein
LYVWQKITKVTTPYFYIIKHKPTGKKYAGSRWAKGCHPDEFMKNTGYCTSSPIVKDLIKLNGLDAFEVLTIELMDDPYTYETVFLQETDCAKSDEWLNTHNNVGASFGTKHFKAKAKETFQNNLGVDNPSQSDLVKEKKRKTLIENFGVSQTMESPELRQKIINTNLQKYGVKFAISAKQVRQKSKQSYIKKYGVENPFQSTEVKEKIKEKYLKEYGVEHPSQIKFMSDVYSKKTYNKASVTKMFPELREFY